MNPPLAITRCALLTPLDTPHLTTWDAIQAGHSVTHPTAVADDLLDPDPSLDRSIRLALAVARKALPDLPIDDSLHLFCATSKGPITTWLAAAESLRNNQPLTKTAAEHLLLGTGAMAACLSHRLRLKGPAHTSVAACSSGIHALHRAAQALWRGECQKALVVAADASLHPLFPASLARLGVLAPADAQGIRHCAPFDPRGRGFFLIEAAALLLERPEPRTTDHESRITPLARLTHTWIGADASDLIAVDPATTSLRHGLKKILTPHLGPPATNPETLAFIHAHATGTSHDAYELAALRSLTPPNTPIFSHKKYLGHSLGAAGLVSVALSIVCHQNHRTLDGQPLQKSASLTIAQGFGGHIGLVALKSP